MTTSTLKRCWLFAALSGIVSAMILLLVVTDTTQAEDRPTAARAVAEVIAQGFEDIVDIASPPCSPDTIFVAERSGVIKALSGSEERDEYLLDIEEILSSEPGVGLESIAISPSSVAPPTLFITYTDKNGDTILASVPLPNDGETATPDDMTVLLKIVQRNPIHPQAIIRFDVDGYLLVIVGNLERQTDAQQLETLRGSILRLDVSDPQRYQIPSDNPPAGTPSHAHEIWARGVETTWGLLIDQSRNPPLLGLSFKDSPPALYPLQKGRNYTQPCAKTSCTQFLLPLEMGKNGHCKGAIRYHGTLFSSLKDQILIAEEGAGIFALSSSSSTLQPATLVAPIAPRKIRLLTASSTGEPLLATDRGELLTLRPL